MKMEFTDTEKICKYCYDNNISLDRLDAGEVEDEGLKAFDLETFRNDKLFYFTRNVKRFSEDVIIPDGFDVMVLRQARYMPIKNHSHEYLEFVYLMEGTTIEVIDGIRYDMEAGDLFLLSPGTDHYDITFNDNALLFFIMAKTKTFDTAFLSLLKHDDVLSRFFSQVVFNKLQDRHILIKTAEDDILKTHIYNLFAEFEDMNPYTSRIANVEFEWLCIHLLQKHISNIQDTDSDERSLTVKKILFYIEEHFRTVTLDEVCARFSYSRGHVQRIIKNETGLTFTEFVSNVRIKRACELLNNLSIPIREISEAVGFNDDSSFYRCFKKQTGISPSSYRNSTLSTGS